MVIGTAMTTWWASAGITRAGREESRRVICLGNRSTADVRLSGLSEPGAPPEPIPTLSWRKSSDPPITPSATTWECTRHWATGPSHGASTMKSSKWPPGPGAMPWRTLCSPRKRKIRSCSPPRLPTFRIRDCPLRPGEHGGPRMWLHRASRRLLRRPPGPPIADHYLRAGSYRVVLVIASDLTSPS